MCVEAYCAILIKIDRRPYTRESEERIIDIRYNLHNKKEPVNTFCDNRNFIKLCVRSPTLGKGKLREYGAIISWEKQTNNSSKSLHTHSHT